MLSGRKELLFVLLLLFVIPISLALPDYPNCTESNKILDCSGTLSNTTFDINNASIEIHDTILDATATNLIRINTTAGYINISSNVTFNAYGGNGGDGSGCNGHGTSGSSSLISFYANNSHPILITNSTLNGYGGSGGDGGFCNDNSGNLFGGNGGSGGNGLIIFYKGSEVNITNSPLNGNGGIGGIGGATLDQNQDSCSNCPSSCSAVGGNGGSGGIGNITFYTKFDIKDSTLNSSGGNAKKGGQAKTTDNSDFYGCTGGTGGNGGIGSFYSNVTNEDNLLTNSSIISYSGLYGIKGTYYGGVGSECICDVSHGTDGNNGHVYFDFIASIFRIYDVSIINTSIGAGTSSNKIGRSYSYFEIIEEFTIYNTTFDSKQPATNYPIINLTNDTSDKIGIFNGSVIQTTTYVHCSAPNITIGNDTTLDTNLDFTNCPAYQDGNITWQSYDQFHASAPKLTDIDFSPTQGNIYNNTNLTAIVNYSDAQSDIGTVYVKWWVNDTLVYTESNSSVNSGEQVNFTLNENNFSKNLQVNMSIWATDGGGLTSTNRTDNLTVSNSLPTVPSITSPENDSSFNVNYTGLNFSSTDADKDTITYSIYGDSTDATTLIFNGTAEGFNWTELSDATYYWKVHAEDGTTNSSNSSAYQFTISTTSPAITLNYPSDNEYLNAQDIIFNFTATDSDGLGDCILYTNATGTWAKNETIVDPVSGELTNFTTNTFQDESNYIWNVYCNDTLDNDGFATNNYSVYVDTIDPNITITQPTGGKTSTTGIAATFSIIDFTKESCTYSVGSSTDSQRDVANTSIGCNETGISFDVVTGDASYVFYLYGNDSAGNYNESSSNFTIDTSTPVTPPSTGGGATTTTVIISEEDIEYEIQSENGGDFYSLFIAPGGFRKKEIKVINKQEPLNGLNFECLGDHCSFLTFEDNDVTIPAKTTEIFYFNLNIPENTKVGDYDLRIKATYKANSGQEYPSFLTVFINVRNWGKIFDPICISLEEGFHSKCSKGLPTWVGLILLWFIMAILFSTLPLLVIKESAQRKLVPAVGVSISIVLIVIITILII